MSKSSNNQDFKTVPEVAEMLKVSERTVRELIKDEKLKGFKKLNKWFVFVEDINDYIRS